MAATCFDNRERGCATHNLKHNIHVHACSGNSMIIMIDKSKVV